MYLIETDSILRKIVKKQMQKEHKIEINEDIFKKVSENKMWFKTIRDSNHTKWYYEKSIKIDICHSNKFILTKGLVDEKRKELGKHQHQKEIFFDK